MPATASCWAKPLACYGPPVRAFYHVGRRPGITGEQITPDGRRLICNSGLVNWSRQGDGRATLGPMLREYIISEAVCPWCLTTRSLAVVRTGEGVRREKVLPGAVLCRVAASHLRVGTFQFAATWGKFAELKALADYTLQRHFPEYKNEADCYLKLYEQVVDRQAKLIAKWQLVGFIHGVMNTDNMTISGETIDYGPCAFMDTYDPATSLAPLTMRAAMLMVTSRRLAAGIWPASLKHCCRFSIQIKSRL